MSAGIEAAVLAAGLGSRAGGAKHLRALRGTPLLEHVVRALSGARLMRISVVLRPGDVEGRALAQRLGARALEAESADEGRAASLRAAVRACAPEASALLIALADQPFLTSADFAALCAASAAHTIIRARYAGEFGSPVLFDRAFFPELLELRGREGGRAVIARQSAAIRAIDLPPAHGRDLDRPEDFARAAESGS